MIENLPDITPAEVWEMVEKTLRYGVDWGKKENKMEKVYSFETHSIALKDLVDLGACDEGIVWFVKNITVNNIERQSLEYIYKKVPKDSWREWLVAKFPEYIKENETYCCLALKMRRNSGMLSYSSFGRHWSYKQTPNNDGDVWDYCPFCGKKL